jgi:hypothetical protein
MWNVLIQSILATMPKRKKPTLFKFDMAIFVDSTRRRPGKPVPIRREWVRPIDEATLDQNDALGRVDSMWLHYGRTMHAYDFGSSPSLRSYLPLCAAITLRFPGPRRCWHFSAAMALRSPMVRGRRTPRMPLLRVRSALSCGKPHGRGNGCDAVYLDIKWSWPSRNVNENPRRGGLREEPNVNFIHGGKLLDGRAVNVAL